MIPKFLGTLLSANCSQHVLGRLFSYDMAQTCLTSISDITAVDLFCIWLSIFLSLLYTIIRFNVSIIGMTYTSKSNCLLGLLFI